MLLNTGKTKVLLMTTRQRRIRLYASLLSLSYNEIDLQLTIDDKTLGVYIEENFQWNNHFQHVCKTVSSYIWLLSKSVLNSDQYFTVHTYSLSLTTAISYGEILLIIMFPK